MVCATVSQYTAVGNKAKHGKSACTAIAVVGLAKLMQAGSFDTIATQSLNKIVEDGIDLWKKVPPPNEGEHLEFGDIIYVDELRSHGVSADLFNEDNDINAVDGSVQQFTKMIEESLRKSKGKVPLALAITAQALSLCVIVKSPAEFWLFDSHGKNEDLEKFAYVEQFKGKDNIVRALEHRFPFNEYLNNQCSITILHKKN